jgi:hypothetical protein
MEITSTNNRDIVRERIPPYVAYRTFMNFLNAIGPGLPSRIDRSVVSSLSGAVQGQLISALRYFNLIGLDGQLNQSLRALVAAEGLERQQLLKSMITDSYRFVFEGSIDLERATMGELSELFAEQQITGETMRKAIGFFLAICRAAGIRLSTQLARVRRRRINGRRFQKITERNSGGQNRQDSGSKPSQQGLPKLPPFDSEWSDEIKLRWFDLLEKSMGQNVSGIVADERKNQVMV